MTPRFLACMGLTIVLLVFAKDQGPDVAQVTLIGMMVLALRFFVLPRVLTWRLSERGQRALNVVLVAGLWLALLACFMTHFVPPKLFLPIAILGGVWFLLEKESERLVDTLFVTLVGFFAVVVLVVSELELAVTAPLAAVLAYLLMTAYGLLDQERVRESIGVRKLSTKMGRDHAPRMAWLVVAIGLALVIPDPDELGAGGGHGDGESDTGAIIGFSNRVDYSMFGPLKNNSALALTVKLGNDDTAEALEEAWYDAGGKDSFYLRAGTLGLKTPNGFAHYESAKELNCPSTIKLRRLGLQFDTIVQTISLAPHDGRELFALPNAVRSENLQHVVKYGLIKSPRKVTEPINYIARSVVLRTESRERIRRHQAAHPDKIYSRWEAGPRGPEVLGLVAKILGERWRHLRGYDAAKGIESFFKQRTEYTYNRNVPNYGRYPLEGFLFNEEKRGTCIHFAGAMVMMLRTLRIPARVVAGFRGATYSEKKQAFKVLASNAHAWVEVCFENVGWVAFDPTPPERELDNPVAGWDSVSGSAGNKLESRRGQGKRETLAASLDSVEESGLPRWWPVAAVCGGLILFVVIRRLIRRRYAAADCPALSAEESERKGLWQSFVVALKQRGAKPTQSKTLQELVVEASPMERSEGESMNKVVSMLYRDSYGGRPFEPQKVSKAVAELQANAKKPLRKSENA